MARVPVTGGPSVSTGNLADTTQSTSAVTAEAFGAPQGQALQNLGGSVNQAADVAADIITENQLRENELNYKNLQVEFNQLKQTLARGDGTPESRGWRDLEGQAAVDNADDTRKALEESAQQFIDRDQNPRVREAFTSWVRDSVTAEQKAIDEYTAGQRTAAEDQTDQALINQMGQDIADDPNNLEENLIRRQNIESTAEAILDRRGVTDQTTRDLFVRQQLTVAHEGAVNRLLVQNPAAARAYYEHHKGEVLPLSQTAIEQKLKTGETLQAASQNAEQIFDPNASISSMQAEARRLAGNDAQLARETIKDLQLRRDAYERDVAIEKEADRTILSEHAKTGEPLPADVRERASASDLANMHTLQRSLASQEPIVTDHAVFEDLMSLTGREAADIDLLAAEAQLSAKDFNTVRQHKIAAIQNVGEDPANPVTPTQMFNATSDSLSLSGENNSEARGRFRAMFLDELGRQTEIKGSDLNTGEVRDILDGLTDELVKNRSFFPGQKRTQAFDVDVTIEDRRRVLRAYEAAGLPKPSRFDIARITFMGEDLPEPAQAAPQRNLEVSDSDRSLIIEAYQAQRANGDFGPNAPELPTEDQIREVFNATRGNR